MLKGELDFVQGGVSNFVLEGSFASLKGSLLCILYFLTPNH